MLLLLIYKLHLKAGTAAIAVELPTTIERLSVEYFREMDMCNAGLVCTATDIFISKIFVIA